jgi:hypothetical protein
MVGFPRARGVRRTSEGSDKRSCGVFFVMCRFCECELKIA